MDCSFIGTFNFSDIIGCSMQAMGLGWEIFSLFIIVAFIIFAAAARLEFNMSLALAWILTFCLMLMVGGSGSYMLQVIFLLLTLGIALKILIGILGIFRQ